VHRIFSTLISRALGGVVCLAMALPVIVRAGGPDEAVPGEAAPVQPVPAVTVVEIKTTMGAILLELDAAKAPVTVENFLRYASSGHYDGTVFHRVVGGYMILGGGFEKKGAELVEKPTEAPIKNEAANGLRNVEGTIAMARTDAPDTATAQFFINCRDNEMLDHAPAAIGYTVFGRVTKGMDVVKQINAVPTGVREVQGRLGNGQLRPMPIKSVPLSDVVIESVRVLKKRGEAPATNAAGDEDKAGGETKE
jgi:cyclophilin family peptidyl-prolyl cis-trans isomerase